MQNVSTGLKVTRVICTSVSEVQCTTTTLREFLNWANCLGQRMEEGDAKEYWTIYNTYIIHQLVYLMLRDGLTRCNYC